MFKYIVFFFRTAFEKERKKDYWITLQPGNGFPSPAVSGGHRVGD